LVVLLGDLGCYPEERDRHVPYIDASLAAMQFMLALETLGLASCPINWPDIEGRERVMDRELALPRHLRPVMLIALGYPDPAGGVPFSAKKSSELLLRSENDYET
jgi:nitroreductase